MPSLFAYSVCFSSFQRGRFLIRVPTVSSCLTCFDLQISSFVIKVQHTTRLLRPWILLKFVNIAFYLFFARMLHFLNKNTVGFYGKALKKVCTEEGLRNHFSFTKISLINDLRKRVVFLRLSFDLYGLNTLLPRQTLSLLFFFCFYSICFLSHFHSKSDQIHDIKSLKSLNLY